MSLRESLREFLAFKKFITIPLMMIIHVIGAFLITIGSLILIGIGSLILMDSGALKLQFFGDWVIPLSFGSWSGGVYVSAGLVLLIAGNLCWRLFCVYTVIQFRIYEALVSIDRKISSTSITPPPPRPFTERQTGSLFSSTKQPSTQ